MQGQPRRQSPVSSPRRGPAPVRHAYYRLRGELRQGWQTQRCRWTKGASQHGQKPRRTDQSGGPHPISKSNALTEQGNDLLSPSDAGFSVRSFAVSRGVSRNELAPSETLSLSALSRNPRSGRRWTRGLPTAG